MRSTHHKGHVNDHRHGQSPLDAKGKRKITSKDKRNNQKILLWDEDDNSREVQHISPYLIDAESVFLLNREKPLCDVPEMKMGNQPIDNGYYIFTEEEKNAFIEDEPISVNYFHPFLGSREYLYNKKRYILLAQNIDPDTLTEMPKTKERILAVQHFRKNSKSILTRNLAKTPTLFNYKNIPTNDYLVIPEVSSENRKYIPIGFIKKGILSSNLLKIIDSSDLYIFAILTSSVHMVWMRAVAGRLEMRYRYSSGIVYNNFPWPIRPGDTTKLQTLAQILLNARAAHPEACLATLYDPRTMPNDLQKAHGNLDKAVLRLYGLTPRATKEEILTKLFSMYRGFTMHA